MRKKQIALAAALGCTLLLAGHALAAGAGNEPTELDADTVEYDMKTGVIQATDNVLMRQGDTPALQSADKIFPVLCEPSDECGGKPALRR